MSPRVPVAGGGAVGLEVARQLERSRARVDVTLANPQSVSVYEPLLPERASGAIDPPRVDGGRSPDRPGDSAVHSS